MDVFRPHAERTVYRPDIDGLRALAVLLVVFQHAGLRWFGGGYVGVDVFFVLSGYLISGILFREMSAGTFSFRRFYMRRVRRIFPALLAMLLLTTVAAYVFLFPLEMQSYVATLLGALGSYSNVILLHQTGYFAPASRMMPLLHTWSLGVEEQFYVAFPLLLLALHRWLARWMKAALWLLAVVGFALAWRWVAVDAAQAFYLAPLRAWEFLAGILLAAGALPKLTRAWQREAAAAVGLTLIVWAGMRYGETTIFPGLAAFLPVAGAVLVLAAGETGSSFVGRGLSLGPVRFVGLISYSVYLWHWPVVVFQRMEQVLVPERYGVARAQTAVIGVSLVLGALSWRLVETPFRAGRLRRVVPLFAANGAAITVLLVFCGVMTKTDGRPPRWAWRTEAAREFAAAFPEPPQSEWGTCYGDPADFPARFKLAQCAAVGGSADHYLVVGDSHSAALVPGLRAVFPELRMSRLSVAGCAPLLPTGASGICAPFLNFVFGEYLPKRPVGTVILVGRWSHEEALALDATIAWIRQHGMRVAVVGPGIEFDINLVRLMEIARREDDAGLVRRHRFEGPMAEEGEMARLARAQWHVPYLSIYEDVCDASGDCPVRGAGGVPLLWDGDHMSVAGATLFAEALKRRGQLPLR